MSIGVMVLISTVRMAGPNLNAFEEDSSVSYRQQLWDRTGIETFQPIELNYCTIT